MNPNNCSDCHHKLNPDGGWCYMFKYEPIEHCAQFKAAATVGTASAFDFGLVGETLADVASFGLDVLTSLPNKGAKVLNATGELASDALESTSRAVEVVADSAGSIAGGVIDAAGSIVD